MVEAGIAKRTERTGSKGLAGSTGEIDLNKALAGNGNNYVLTVSCHSMAEAGIEFGDRVIVDRGAEPLNGNIVIAEINGSLLIRRLQLTNGKMQLLPAASLAPILIDYYNPAVIWGVVTYVIHKLS